MTRLLFLFALSLQAPQKADSAANRGQTTAPDQRGSDSLPVAVKLLNTGEDEAAAKQNAERILEEKKNARNNLVLTGLLVLATVVSLGVLGYQSYWLKRSVTQAEQATRIELRAYLSVAEVAIRTHTGRVVKQTSAKHLHSWCGATARIPRSEKWVEARYDG